MLLNNHIKINTMTPSNHIDNYKKQINVDSLLTFTGGKDSHYISDVLPEQAIQLRDELESAGVEIHCKDYCSARIDEAKNMAVDGVSKFVPLYRVETYMYEDKIRAAFTSHPYLLINSRLYSVSLPEKGKFVLYYYNSTMPKGFTFGEKRPNQIGKATAKKLAQWVEYLDRKEAAAVEYANKGKKEVADLIAMLDASGVEVNPR